MTPSSTSEAPIVREARAADTGALALLLSELGYPVTPEVLSSRLQKLPSAHCTFVAELEGAVAGFVGCSALDIYESDTPVDRKSTRLNSSHVAISYAVFC